MYPNPQEALPLPASPNLEQYRKLAKDLVKSCKSGDPSTIRAWAEAWIRSIAALQPDPGALRNDAEVGARADQVHHFAREKMMGRGDARPRCALADAQFVIARAHGFLSWARLVKHVESLAQASSAVSMFEAAAKAVVTGDVKTLRRLLQQQPELARARSTREHRATLLHYVSANGVENYRQVSPANAAEITELLLRAGAEVDAEADVYEGRCTPLGLVATSEPPARAGVQLDVIDVMLKCGARMDDGSAGRRTPLVHACLANGQPTAAEYLVSRGAPLELVGAAGLGRVDVVSTFFIEDAYQKSAAPTRRALDAFALACAYGRSTVIEFFLQHGVAVDSELTGHGEGHTGLHVAAFHGHLDAVTLLLEGGASVHAIDKTWGTPPLVWALTGWSRTRAGGPGRYYDVVARLVAAGANVTADLLEWDKSRADPRMIAALTAGRTSGAEDRSR